MCGFNVHVLYIDYYFDFSTEQLLSIDVFAASRAILPEVMTGPLLAGVTREPVRIKAKGLLERRGSSASLTIDLLHPSQENLSVTPTREWSVLHN